MTRDMLLMKVSALANGSIAPQSLMQAIDGYVESALAAERERALRWAVIEVRGALANQHREGYGPYLPAIEQFVQDGLRALTPAPGAADTTTEGNHA